MYAIKFNDKYYFCKYPGNRVGTDIYKAELFDSKDMARTMLKNLLAHYDILEGWEAPGDGPDSFKIVEIEMRETAVVSGKTSGKKRGK